MNIFKDSKLDTTKLMPGIEMQKVGDAIQIVGESLRIIIPSTVKFNEIARGVCITTSGELLSSC